MWGFVRSVVKDWTFHDVEVGSFSRLWRKAFYPSCCTGCPLILQFVLCLTTVVGTSLEWGSLFPSSVRRLPFLTQHCCLVPRCKFPSCRESKQRAYNLWGVGETWWIAHPILWSEVCGQILWFGALSAVPFSNSCSRVNLPFSKEDGA